MRAAPRGGAHAFAEQAVIGGDRAEIERLRAIKRLVEDAGVNLAGVQRLLSIADVVQRIRPLMREEALSTREARKLSQELESIVRMLGFD